MVEYVQRNDIATVGTQYIVVPHEITQHSIVDRDRDIDLDLDW